MVSGYITTIPRDTVSGNILDLDTSLDKILVQAGIDITIQDYGLPSQGVFLFSLEIYSCLKLMFLDDLEVKSFYSL